MWEKKGTPAIQDEKSTFQARTPAEGKKDVIIKRYKKEELEKKRLVSILLTACLVLVLLPAMALAMEENYDTFDYRAYANVYPNVKTAYGYNAEKLYAHDVNYGKAEGRVGRYISGSNPKTDATTHAYGADPSVATVLEPFPLSGNMPAVPTRLPRASAMLPPARVTPRPLTGRRKQV